MSLIPIPPRRSVVLGVLVGTQQLVNIRDTESALGVSRGLVRKLIRQGVLPSVKIARCRRVQRRALERIMREGLPAHRSDATLATAGR